MSIPEVFQAIKTFAEQERAPYGDLHKAAEKGNFEEVQKFIDQGIDVNLKNKNGYSALFFAVRGGHSEVVRMLIGVGAEIEDADLSTAILNDHFDIHELLILKVGVDKADYKEETALFKVAAHGNVRMTLFLLKAGANIECINSRKETPLHHAVIQRHYEIVKILLEAGANVKAEDSSGSTPLDMVANEAIADLLISADANVHHIDDAGCSPLYSAASNGYLNILKKLFLAGADVEVNKRSKAGFTALHSITCNPRSEDFLTSQDLFSQLVLASMNDTHQYLNSLIFLLENGADYKILDNNSHTALFYAYKYKQQEMISVLEKYGAILSEKEKEDLKVIEKKKNSNTDDQDCVIS